MSPSRSTESASEALAHVAPDGRQHLLVEHLQAVARKAGSFAAAFDGGPHAELAGLWHDLGKYAADFQEMIRGANAVATEAHLEGDADDGAPRARARVDHSTAGAFYAASRDAANALPIAFAIAGHHAGLADWRPHLTERFSRAGEPRLRATLARRPPKELLDRAVPVLPERVRPRSKGDGARWRDLDLFTRMLFSALCDADFLDTEAFFDSARASLRGGHLGLADLAARLATSVDALARSDTEVNRVRAEVRAACIEAADGPPGVLTLTVPTGGGKTLASMDLALRHALRHDLRRVIVAIPYTSILEQNAAVYRRAFGLAEDDPSVLEHHSAVDPQRDKSARSRIAAENWDSPVVVTTNVQLLE
ncbi:MAG: CRISPR-associated endonuclease Cas3'', partial [Polyangiaceae bacterium]